MPVYGGSSASGKQKKPRKAKRAKKPSYSSPNAVTGAKGQRKTERAARKAKAPSSVKSIVGAKEDRASRRYRRSVRAVKRIARDAPERQAVTVTDEGRASIPVSDSVAKTASKDPFVRAVKNAPKVPSDVEFALMLATGGRGTALKSLGRAVLGARTAKATKVAEKAKSVAKATAKRKPPKATPKPKPKTTKPSRTRTVKNKAKGRTKQAAGKVKTRYSKPQRRVRSAKRTERTLNSTGNPVVPAAMADERVRAFAEGTVKADPVQSAKTTARAIPATFSFLTGLGADAARAAVTGDTGPLKGTLKEGGQALKALEPLVSGDPEKVEQATEQDVGYVFAPLLPKGAVSAPVRAAGRGTRATAKAIVAPVKKRTPKSEKTSAKRGLMVTQRKDRRRTARLAAEEQHSARFEAQRAGQRVERKARKTKRARSPRNVRGLEAADAAAVVANYGISRKNAAKQLDEIVRSLKPRDGAPAVNTQKVAGWLKQHPEVLADDNFWALVKQSKDEIRATETSPRAKYLAQARVVGETEGRPILKPEERAPKAVRDLTGAASRQEGWNEFRVARTELVKAKGALRSAARSGDHARVREAKARVRHAEDKALAIYKPLRKLIRPGQEPTIRSRRKPWTKDMVDDFVAETKQRAEKRGYDEPTWTSEPRMATEPDAVAGAFEAGGAQPRRVHIKTGKAEKGDIADRSYQTFVRKTIMGPRLAKGMARFVRRWSDEMSRPKTLDGKRRKVFNSDEIPKLIEDGEFNPRTEMLVPSRHVKAALDAEAFDSVAFHSEATKNLRGEFDAAQLQKGTKYIIVSREAGREFLDQISPKRGMFEATTAAFGTASSRIILSSPAWLASQIPATGFQAAASMSFNPVAFAKAAYAVERLRHTNPLAYEQLAARAGRAGPLIDQPSSGRVGQVEQASGASRRALRHSWVGRRADEAMRLQTLGLIDRWQTGKFREVALAAKIDREYNGLKAKFKAPLRQQSHIAKQLKGKSRAKQLEWFAEHPKALSKHVEYLNRVMGDWHTYTRVERAWAGATIFYPFVRMSLTWPTRFAKEHPTTATALYLLAQENSNTLEELLGDDDLSFLEYANAVVHGEDGEADLLLPGARRFAAPGLNVLTESAAEGNTAGLLRALNPVMSAPIFAATGTDPFSGEKTDEPFSDQLLSQLISLLPAARAADLPNKATGQEPSPISDALREIDPRTKERSILNPFAPITVNRAKERKGIIDALEKSSYYDSEVGQFLKAVERYGEDEAVRRLREDAAAGGVLQGIGPPDPTGDAEFDRLSKLFYGIKFGSEESSTPTRKAKRTPAPSGGGLFKESSSAPSGGGGGLFK